MNAFLARICRGNIDGVFYDFSIFLLWADFIVLIADCLSVHSLISKAVKQFFNLSS